MDLHTAGHRQGVVAAPHHSAVEAGRATLAAGGNALEAMVTMAATIAAVYPHMTQVGGDGFWLVHQPSGRVRALMAPGRAGANARRELYREHETIPPRGPLAALTVPGAIAGWMLALEVARAHGARRARGRGAGTGGPPRPGRAPAAVRPARTGDPPRQGRLHRHPQPGPAHGGEARRAQGCPRLRADIPGRWPPARCRRDAAATGTRGDPRSSRPGRAR